MENPTLPVPRMLFTDPPPQELTTVQASANTTTLSLTDFPLHHLTMDMLRVWPPVLLGFGTFGNLMTIVIMWRLSSDGSVINIYFTATAIMDLLCLYTNTLDRAVLFNWNHDFKTSSRAFCKLFNWLYSVVLFSSTWFLVCMTVHRAMSIVWPHRINLLCTRRTVVLVLTGVTVFNALLGSVYLVTFDITVSGYLGEVSCLFASKAYELFFINIFVYIDFALISIFPYLIFVCANSVLAWKLIASVREAGRSLAGHGATEQVKGRQKEATSVTVTILTVSTAFLVLTLPFSISYIVYFDTSITQTSPSVEEIVWGTFVSHLCDMLRQANNAVNFYLYILTGRRFRKEFVKVMSFWKTSEP